MFKNEIGQDSPIPKFIYLKIRRRDGEESLTFLEEGEFKVPIDGCIKKYVITYTQRKRQNRFLAKNRRNMRFSRDFWQNK